MTRQFSIVEICRMYYEQGKNQEAIAKEFGISRSTISRMLKQAREMGIVRVQIVDPNSVCSEIGAQLQKRFGLEKAVVVEGSPESDDLTQRDVGMAAAELLGRMVRSGQTIGTCWGSTIYECVRSLKPKPVSGVKVVQFVGTVGSLLSHTHADQLARLIAQAYGGEWLILPAPAVVANGRSVRMFLDEPQIRQALDAGRSSDIALIGVGVCDESASLVRAGYISAEEMSNLKALGAIGEVGCRFYDIHGVPCHSDIDERTISINLHDLRKIPMKIGVATGLRKIRALYGAIAGGYINMLVTDLMTAQKLLSLDEYGQKHRNQN